MDARTISSCPSPRSGASGRASMINGLLGYDPSVVDSASSSVGARRAIRSSSRRSCKRSPHRARWPGSAERTLDEVGRELEVPATCRRCSLRAWTVSRRTTTRAPDRGRDRQALLRACLRHIVGLPTGEVDGSSRRSSVRSSSTARQRRVRLPPSLTQEVAYGSQLLERRVALHAAVARAPKKCSPTGSGSVRPPSRITGRRRGDPPRRRAGDAWPHSAWHGSSRVDRPALTADHTPSVAGQRRLSHNPEATPWHTVAQGGRIETRRWSHDGARALSALRAMTSCRPCTRGGAVGDVAPIGRSRLDSLLREGSRRSSAKILPTAAAVFTRLIEEAPTFAEGWNKRATVRYLAKDYSGAIADCRETLARNPNHFGALSGQASATWGSASS